MRPSPAEWMLMKSDSFSWGSAGDQKTTPVCLFTVFLLVFDLTAHVMFTPAYYWFEWLPCSLYFDEPSMWGLGILDKQVLKTFPSW